MQYGSPRSPTNGVGMDLDSDPSSTQLPVVPNKQEEADRVRSLHGDSAAQRRAITELLFFASVGDVRRCERLCRVWNLDVSRPDCCDYDKRTPLHLAAAEGSYSVCQWLLQKGARIDALDRFKRTALEDAINGSFNEVVKLLSDSGAKVHREGQFVGLGESNLSGVLASLPKNDSDIDTEWEIDPSMLRMQEKLGEGEFGVVHKAVWHGTSVAVKTLKISSQLAVGDFRSEVELLQRIHHPNCCQLLGACSKQEPYTLITELMTGGSLADAFKRQRAFGTRRSLEIAADCARGMAYLHNKKPSAIVHRDLKPGNLMIAGSHYYRQDKLVYDIGTIKLADFGLSKSLPYNKHAQYDLDETFKLTGETGSYRYMAPEVFRHEPYNSSVDVYSFSMILYQLFEHHPPFAGQDPVSACKLAAMENKRPELQRLNDKDPVVKETRELIQKCWAPDSSKRPQFPYIVEVLERLIERQPRREVMPGSAGGGGGGGSGMSTSSCCSLQ